MVVAKWKSGTESLHGKVDAQKVAEEILSIGESVTPQEIVDYARDEGTELHKCFTWDDTEAAKKWRKFEARQIVCHLVCRRPPEDEGKPEIRVLHKTEEGEGYKPVTLIVRREDEYTAMLNRALGELKAFQKKYAVLSDAEELRSMVEKIEEMIAAA